MEENGTQSYAARACKIVCKGLKNAGYKPGVYSSLSWWNTYLKSITEYDKWVAQWAAKCTYAGKYLMWQYSENGRVNGVSGNVDMNVYYGEQPAAKALKKTNEDIAREVIVGKWGNSEARKTTLTKAGYDYNSVQKIVNQLCSKKSDAEIAHEVIAGKWGNGTDRKNRLESAGYDYSAVQKEVNGILGV